MRDFKVEVNLAPVDAESDKPVVTAVVQRMSEGDLIVGIRPYLAHADSEFAIVGIAVDEDGSLNVRIMDGEGAYLTESFKVRR